MVHHQSLTSVSPKHSPSCLHKIRVSVESMNRQLFLYNVIFGTTVHGVMEVVTLQSYSVISISLKTMKTVEL